MVFSDIIYTLIQKPDKKIVGNYPFHKVFVCEKEVFYSYDDLGSVSNARRIQLDGFMQGQMKLNIGKETFRIITKKMYEQAELSHSIIQAHKMRLNDGIKQSQVNSQALKPIIEDDTIEQAMVMVANIRDISLELCKRTQMLTLPEMIYKVAAILYFNKKDDPRAMITDEEINRRVKMFQKKNMVLELLRLPMSNFWENLQGLDENSMTYMAMQILEQNKIATLQEEVFLAGS